MNKTTKVFDKHSKIVIVQYSITTSNNGEWELNGAIFDESSISINKDMWIEKKK